MILPSTTWGWSPSTRCQMASCYVHVDTTSEAGKAYIRKRELYEDARDAIWTKLDAQKRCMSFGYYSNVEKYRKTGVIEDANDIELWKERARLYDELNALNRTEGMALIHEFIRLNEDYCRYYGIYHEYPQFFSGLPAVNLRDRETEWFSCEKLSYTKLLNDERRTRLESEMEALCLMQSAKV